MLDAFFSIFQTTLPIPFIQVRIADVLDILILTFLLYKLIWTLRKTSAGGVLRGIVILIFAMWLSASMSLSGTSYLLNWVLEFGALALVILFQPELRRMLEKIGRTRMGMLLASPPPEATENLQQAILEVVQAYEDMSRDKCGALMVFERQNVLDDIIKTGTPLDCGISSELLKNLFWNKAPLHDGAVIVRGGRIVGAGCMLPLSGNVNLSRDLGMRHRAGIGISEKTDAFVCIVSEETGSISVAQGGMLKRHLTPATLEVLLRNELLGEAEESRRPAILSQILGRNRKEETEG